MLSRYHNDGDDDVAAIVVNNYHDLQLMIYDLTSSEVYSVGASIGDDRL